MVARALQTNMDDSGGNGEHRVRDGRKLRQNSRPSLADLLHHKITPGRRLACNVALMVITMIAGLAGATLANRGQPFEFVHTYIKPELAPPGGKFTIFFIARNITKNCPGTVRRAVVDSKGNIWPLQTTAADYFDNDDDPARPTHTFAHTFRLDEAAAPGPAVYRSRAQFWCNIFQKYIWPIDGETTVVDFTISALSPH